MTVALTQSPFGSTAAGLPVELFTFTDPSGVLLSVTNYGGIVQSYLLPDRDGTLADVVLGFDTLAEYEADQRFFGCVVGRYANRIANGRFTLNGVEYQLETNPKGHHIHGGSEGFHKQVWQASIEQRDGVPLLVLQHQSPDGHGGFPGCLDCRITYALKPGGAIEIVYHASTDKPTIVNLTNHTYFNLAGQDRATENGVLDHLLQLDCDQFLPTNDCGIPLSGPVAVEGTVFDFRSETSFAARIHNADEQLQNVRGYDHTFVVNRRSNELQRAAVVTDPVSGRSLEVVTTQPGIQVYTGNNVPELRGKGGMSYRFRGALCLETQHFPDSPNRPDFPTTVLMPDKPFHEATVFRPLTR